MADTSQQPLAPAVPASVFLSGEDLSALPLIQRGFILAIRGIERNLSPGTTGQQVKAMVAEAYPPASLFDPDLAAYPTIYLELRTWLNRNGAALGTHPSRRVINLLANKLYDQEDDREEAKELGRLLLQSQQTRSRRTATGGGAVSQGDNNNARAPGGAQNTPFERHAHNIGTRYRDERSKFTGAADQSFSEYVSGYQQVCRDYGLSNDQKFMLLHNLFGGEAKRFYDNRVEHQVATYAEAISRMSVQYDTYVRQMEAKNELGSLRLDKLVAEGRSEKDALTHIYESITKLSPQLPEIHRGDGHKLVYLRSAVVGIPWTRLPIARLSTTPMDFQQLYDELKAALQLEQEYRSVTSLDATDSAGTTTLALRGTVNPTMYAGQGMYGRPNRTIGNTRPTRPLAITGRANSGGRGARFDPLTVAGCFNCDSPNHVMKQCPRPINAVKASERKVAYYDKKMNGGRASVAAVLYQLVTQIHPDVAVEDVCQLEDILMCDGPADDDQPSVSQPDVEIYYDSGNEQGNNGSQAGTSADHAVRFARGV